MKSRLTSPDLVISGFAEINMMADPDETRPSEIELEMRQRARPMELFSLVETYDGRESVIAFCESVINMGTVD